MGVLDRPAVAGPHHAPQAHPRSQQHIQHSGVLPGHPHRDGGGVKSERAHRHRELSFRQLPHLETAHEVGLPGGEHLSAQIQYRDSRSRDR